MEKRILLASPRGFCLGVKRAVAMLEEAVGKEKVYVRGEIVHNKVLVERFRTLGAVSVGEVDEVPEGGTVVFSAHGVAPSVRERAAERELKVIDTTCPLVEKVHKEAARLGGAGYTVILIGEAGHSEVIGIAGEAPDNIRVIQSETDIDGIDAENSRIAWLSQTTLNEERVREVAERLRSKFPLILEPSGSCVCYATRNRRFAVKSIAGECDLFVVVGSANSSNTSRLAEAAYTAGAREVIRADGPEELYGVDFSGVGTVGVSSGVSVENRQLESVVAYLKNKGYTRVEERIAVAEEL